MKRSIFYRIRRKLQIAYFNCFSRERVSKTYFKIVLKYKLNLENPKTFNEKIQWLKLYEWPNNELAILCSDKYRVREYLEKNNLQEYENKILGVYDNAKDISWDELPNKFVVKCNHGCAYNIICTNKSNLDTKKAVKQLNKWMKEDFGKFNAEVHYSRIQPKIIIEEYLGDNLEDYKFFCFNGKFKLLYIAVDSESKTSKEREAFFDENGKLLKLQNADYGEYTEARLPNNFKELIKVSETLAKPFPFVRVDWYIKNGKTTFGELTFTPSGGMMKLNPAEYDKTLGEFLDISELMKKKEIKDE